MSAEEILRESESTALKNNQIVANVKGKTLKSKGKMKGFTALGFIAALVIVAAVFFGSGNLIPSALSERLLEETDVQYADAVESKKLVFQQAMRDGEIPENTARILKENGVEVGYTQGEGFVEGNKHSGELVLRTGGRIITADNFVTEVGSDLALYEAFNSATYSRAAYYYDEAAHKVFEKIGTNRNNFTADADFDEVMNRKMGSGSDVNVNSVSLVQSDEETDLAENGAAANSKDSARTFVEKVRDKNPAETAKVSAMNTADALKVADTTSKEQRSSLFFALILENVSQMKYGDGNNAKLNEAMNYLYDEAESEVVDVETGEIVKVKGSAMESPSLYAVLSGEKMDPKLAANYSSDRILKMVENKVSDKNGKSAIDGTVASTTKGVKGSIGRLIKNGLEMASNAIVDLVSPTVSSSLVENSYDTIKGINAGEFLVEGAVNTGKMLAKESGATPGDAATAAEYARVNAKIVAMDAEVDRKNRSPFDVTSKNTFLGSIIYNFAVSNRGAGSSLFARGAAVMGGVVRAVAAMVPGVHAEATEGYMTSFGDCETYGNIGAVGTPQCSEVAVFDMSTLNNTFNDPGFKKFVEDNTTLSEGTRTINDNSVLARFLTTNDERETPLGVMDGGILDSLSSGSGSIPFLSDILSMIRRFLGASEEDKRIASGAAFVYSSTNKDWDTYKYAQRYVSLARATAALRQYADGSTAYDNLKYFEGRENPVIAYLNHYYETIANR